MKKYVFWIVLNYDLRNDLESNFIKFRSLKFDSNSFLHQTNRLCICIHLNQFRKFLFIAFLFYFPNFYRGQSPFEAQIVDCTWLHHSKYFMFSIKLLLISLILTVSRLKILLEVFLYLPRKFYLNDKNVVWLQFYVLS